MTQRIVGAKYEVIERSNFFSEGDIVYLVDDDGTVNPWFANRPEDSRENYKPLYMNRVRLMVDFGTLPIGTELYHKDSGGMVKITGYEDYITDGGIMSDWFIEGNYTLEKPEEPPIKEVTMQEIADKFGIDVDALRVKD